MQPILSIVLLVLNILSFHINIHRRNIENIKGILAVILRWKPVRKSRSVYAPFLGHIRTEIFFTDFQRKMTTVSLLSLNVTG